MPNKKETPLQIMERSQRIMDFSSDGKPLHPLRHHLPKLKTKSKLPHLGPNQLYSFIYKDTSDNSVLLVQHPSTRQWILPTIETLPKQNHSSHKIYSGMDNFNVLNSLHAWVEREVYLQTIKDKKSLNSGKWFEITNLPKKMNILDRILLTQH
jgi:hypothetical protein